MSLGPGFSGRGPGRRSRALSAGERRLWAEVAQTINPLTGRVRPVVQGEPVPAPPREPPAGPAPPAPSEPSRPRAPPLAQLERKTVRALARGRRQVDDVIDLHGLRQAEAHRVLLAFLRRSQAGGRTLVLVVTGKGGASDASPAGGEERGVLRRVVPHWLRLPELRALVLGFEEAAPHRGGAGALYVRLRRGRP